MTLDILQLNQDDWRASIGGGNFDRGVRYAAEGRSQLLSLHQQTLMASCRGTSGQVYRQRIQLQAQEFGWRIDGHCGCPVRYNCKHVVAALLTLQAQQEAGLEAMSKKEQLMFVRELEKLEKDIGGIQDMAALPDAIFVIDVGFHKIAVAEAKKLGIPLIGVVDTNHSPEGIDYVIPGNDDSAKAVTLYARGIADAIIEGRANAVNEVVKAVAPEGSDEFVEVQESAA